MLGQMIQYKKLHYQNQEEKKNNVTHAVINE